MGPPIPGSQDPGSRVSGPGSCLGPGIWVLGPLGPKVLGCLGLWILGSLGPLVFGSLGPLVLGSLGPLVHGSLGLWILGSMIGLRCDKLRQSPLPCWKPIRPVPSIPLIDTTGLSPQRANDLKSRQLKPKLLRKLAFMLWSTKTVRKVWVMSGTNMGGQIKSGSGLCQAGVPVFPGPLVPCSLGP